jgi:hypothetical protein
MIDFALLVILALVTWCVASEGAWGAAFMFLTVLMSGMLAMNFFEPLADFFDTLGMGPDWSPRWDFVALVGLFAGLVFGIRTALEKLMPTLVLVQPMSFDVVRWLCGLGTGYVTMAFLLTALHTSTLPREFMGFTPERKNFFNFSAPDRQWLGFVQYASEKVYPTGNVFDGPQFTIGPYQYPEMLKASQYGNPEVKESVWPSFIIRYATRRDDLAAGGGGVVDQAPAQGPAGPAMKPAF